MHLPKPQKSVLNNLSTGSGPSFLSEVTTSREKTVNDLITMDMGLLGLLALIPSRILAERIAALGYPSFYHVLTPCLGILEQQDAPKLWEGGQLAGVRVFSGRSCSIRNQGTCLYLQRAGLSGYLTRISVGPRPKTYTRVDLLRGTTDDEYNAITKESDLAYQKKRDSGLTKFFRVIAFIFSLFLVGDLLLLSELYAVYGLVCLVVAQLLTTVVLKCRISRAARTEVEDSKSGVWSQTSEQEGDDRLHLFVALPDRKWLVLSGTHSDVRRVMTTRWMAEPTSFESFLAQIATGLVYFTPVLVANGSAYGAMVFAWILLISAYLMKRENSYSFVPKMEMFGVKLRVEARHKHDAVEGAIAEVTSACPRCLQNIYCHHLKAIRPLTNAEIGPRYMWAAASGFIKQEEAVSIQRDYMARKEAAEEERRRDLTGYGTIQCRMPRLR
ncbi:hypothetical protein BJ508DRAFT_362846 [Ascobolus immersus RN42]|uniref:Uncharacterized protein n=1 Tax=Ascobolus immersus RN42 TaxID=1160509 RepID=A0A3N4I5J0_ASCIM|nr:hypothetical protein BJ508DRAFT_362846 [Ascobolus immersus RN42]